MDCAPPGVWKPARAKRRVLPAVLAAATGHADGADQVQPTQQVA